MTSLFEELAEILTRQAEAHERLLAAAQEVNRAAKSGDLACLKRFTTAMDEEIHRIEKLEDERKFRCAALASATGRQGGSVRLPQIIAGAPELVRTRLESLRTRLKEHLSAIASVNGANRLLCHEGARIAGEHLSLLLRPKARFTNYRESGARCAPGGAPISLINRTA